MNVPEQPDCTVAPGAWWKATLREPFESPMVAEDVTGFLICRLDPSTVLAASQNTPSVDSFKFPLELKKSNLSGLVKESEAIYFRAREASIDPSQAGLGDWNSS